jgi:hypothetical protein
LLLVEPVCPAGVPTDEDAPVSLLCGEAEPVELEPVLPVELEAEFGDVEEFWSVDDELLGELLVELEELGLEDVEELGLLLDCDPHEPLELDELGLDDVEELGLADVEELGLVDVEELGLDDVELELLGLVVVVVVVVWPVAGLVVDWVIEAPLWLLLSEEGVLLCEEGDDAELEEGEVELCEELLSLLPDWLLLDCSAMKLLCGGADGEDGLLLGFVPVGGFSLMLPVEPLGLLWVASLPVVPVVLELLEVLPTLEDPAAPLLPEFEALEL